MGRTSALCADLHFFVVLSGSGQDSFALEYIDEDELIEVTPQSIRLRKRQLAAVDRKKAARAAARVENAS